jgi:hypothetical protein
MCDASVLAQNTCSGICQSKGLVFANIINTDLENPDKCSCFCSPKQLTAAPKPSSITTQLPKPVSFPAPQEIPNTTPTPITTPTQINFTTKKQFPCGQLVSVQNTKFRTYLCGNAECCLGESISEQAPTTQKNECSQEGVWRCKNEIDNIKGEIEICRNNIWEKGNCGWNQSCIQLPTPQCKVTNEK